MSAVLSRIAGRDPVALAVSAVAVVIALLFLVYPLANGLLLAFLPNGAGMAWDNLTLANFGRFFTAGSYRRAVYNTILTSGGALGYTTAIESFGRIVTGGPAGPVCIKRRMGWLPIP